MATPSSLAGLGREFPPALVVEPTATFLVPPDYDVAVDRIGNLVARRRKGAP